jgi:hypothetical protein
MRARALRRRYGRARRSRAERLFIGVSATGLSYADRSREEHGDYKKVAFLPFSTLQLKVYDTKSPLLASVRADAARMQTRRGEQYVVSGTGQTVLLGGPT